MLTANIRQALARASIAAAAITAATAVPAGMSFAQETTILEAITVTARKREENLLEIPESIRAISALTVERANITGLEDIGFMVANLSLSQRADGFPNVSIRGLGSFGNTQGVGFYTDDVQNFTDASARIGDIERIEVLKGPQGTLYGGSNIGGAVRFVSVRPDPSGLSGRVTATAGGQDFRDIEASLNLPLGGDWAMRIFGYAHSDDGYLVNGNLPRANGGEGSSDPEIGRVDENGVRLGIAGALTDRLSLYATLRWNELDAPNNAWTTELDNDFEFPHVLGRTYNPRMYRDTVAGTLEFGFDAGSFDVTAVTSYTDTTLDQNIDLDISQEYVLDLFRPETFEIFTQEVRFTSTGAGPFKWLGGVYYLDYREEMDSVLLFRGGASLFEGIVPTAEEEPLIIDTVPFEDRNRDREQLAAFATASYRTESWEFGAGARVDRWRAYVLNRQTGIAGEEEETEFLPRASVSYFLDDAGSNLYANVAEGFEPGGFNLANFEGSNVLFGYGPEKATSYEVGYKGRLAGGRLMLTLAAFAVEYRDRQFELQTTDPVTGNIVEGILNAGDSSQYGAEIDLTWQATENLAVSLAAGFVDAEWDNGTVLDDGTDLSGLTPPYMAENSGTVALDYERPFADGWSFLGRVQYTHIGEFETDLGNNFQNPSYDLVNLRLGVARDNWEIAVNVQNLFDEEYYTDTTLFPNFNPLIPQPSLVIGTLGQTRLVTVSASVSF